MKKGSVSSTVVEHSPHYDKVKCLSLASAAGTRERKGLRKLLTNIQKEIYFYELNFFMK
jgi:hypothetical protein